MPRGLPFSPQQPCDPGIILLHGSLVLRQGCGWPGGTQQSRAQGWVCDPWLVFYTRPPHSLGAHTQAAPGLGLRLLPRPDLRWQVR